MTSAAKSRSHALAVAAGSAAVILALQAVPDWQPALEYRRELLAAQPWRLFTAHWVHLSWPHALVNAAAWLLLAPLFEASVGARRQLAVLAAAALAISLGLALLYPSLAWYRGASGVLHALYFAGAVLQGAASAREKSGRGMAIAGALLAGGWIKVALELPPDAQTSYAEWLAAPIVPQAHLLGALAGCVAGVALALRAPLSR